MAKQLGYFDFYKVRPIVLKVRGVLAKPGSNATTFVGEPYGLDGSGSLGDNLAYTWSFQSQPEGSTATLIDDDTATPTFTPDVEGDYVIELTVSDGESSHSSTVTIKAEPPPGSDFSLSIPSGPVTIARGRGYGPIDLTITRTGGFSADIYFTLLDPPEGVSATFLANPDKADTTSNSWSLSIALNAPLGFHTFAIQGVADGIVRQTEPFELTILEAGILGSFELSLNPANLTLVQGATATVGVNIARINYFGNVTLSLLSTPSPGPTGTFSPQTVSGNESTLTLDTTGVAPGSYTLTITGEGDGISRSATLPLTIQPLGDFNLAVVPDPVIIAQGESYTSVTLMVTRTEGFSGNIVLELLNVPDGITPSPFAINPDIYGITPNGWSFSAASDVPVGDHTLTVRGISGSLVRETSFTLTITEPLLNLAWVRQFGTEFLDIAEGVAVDAGGNVYTAATMYAGPSNGADAFLLSHDAAGNETWRRQYHMNTWDRATSVAVASDGSVYITGLTMPLIGSGNHRAFLIKYRPDEDDPIWVREIWAEAFTQTEAFGLALDASGNVYVAGATNGAFSGATHAGDWDAFLVKYGPNGHQVWVRQFGTASPDEAFGVAVDSGGNVYVAGYMDGVFPRQSFYAPDESAEARSDAFLAKYDGDGNQLWLERFGAGTGKADGASGVVVDSGGNIYVAGASYAALPGETSEGASDFFLARYRPNGTQEWLRQDGTANADWASGVTVGAGGSVYVVGTTRGAFPDQSLNGPADGFLARYSPNGVRSGVVQSQAPGEDGAVDVAVDGGGNVYIVGMTDDAFPGQLSAGELDAVLIKFSR